MPNIIMLKGLPASGKTTWANDRLRNHPGRYLNVNKDDLRAMLFNGHWTGANERIVVQVRDQIVLKGLERGKHVIVSDTNLNPTHEERLRQLARENGANFVIEDMFLDVSVEECIKRDLKRTNSVGEQVIRGMHSKWLKEEVVYTPPENKPEAIIVDLDGTLAHMNGKRGPYEFNKVDGDDLDEAVFSLMKSMYDAGSTILLLSGRDGSCRELTETWLEKNGVIFYEDLWMRTADDKRPDTVIKQELFEKHIRDNYQVRFVVDDRPVMCRFWRDEMGMKVFQVGDPHVEF